MSKSTTSGVAARDRALVKRLRREWRSAKDYGVGMRPRKCEAEASFSTGYAEVEDAVDTRLLISELLERSTRKDRAGSQRRPEGVP